MKTVIIKDLRPTQLTHGLREIRPMRRGPVMTWTWRLRKSPFPWYSARAVRLLRLTIIMWQPLCGMQG